MSVTMDVVAQLPDLGLEVVAGHGGLGNQVRWVHVSELDDPTRWLRGGELLLTTGLRVGSDAEYDAYVRRLAEAGLAGVGFGVGLASDRAPEALRRAADQRDLPVLEIPVETPYVAISEAVSDLLAAERYRAIGAAFDAQQAMTGTALEKGRDGVLADVARAVGGWAILTDATGEVIRACPDDAAARIPALLPDIVRTRQRGFLSTSSLVDRDEAVMIHSLGARRRIRGFLVAGVPGQADDYTRMVLAGGVALLSLEIERAREAANQVRRVRGDMLAQILRGDLSVDMTRQHVSSWQLDPGALRMCALLCPHSRAPQLVDDLNERLADADIAGVVVAVRAARHDRVAVMLGPGEEGVRQLEQMASIRPMVPLGIGDVVDATEVATSFRAATHAAEAGLADRRAITRFEQLDAMRLLLRAQSPHVMESFVRRVLEPLNEHDRDDGELRRTLYSFLVHNGHWNRTAADLGIHRHTLRSRIDRVEEVVGRDLDSAYDRTELWLALLADSYREENRP